MFTFQFLNDKIYSYTKKKPFGTWQFGKIGVLVNFIIQKKKKVNTQFVSVFSDDRFQGMRENIILGPILISTNHCTEKQLIFFIFPSCSLKYLFQSMQSAVRSVFLYQNVKTILCMQKETFSFGKYRNKFKPLMKKLTFLQFLKKE